MSPTSENAHNRLIAAIDYELDHYGVASLADVIATLLDARTQTNAPETEHYRAARQLFEELVTRLNQLPHIQTKGAGGGA